MNIINHFGLYLKERVTVFPWIVLPLYLFYMGHGRAQNYSFILLLSLISGVLFFRLFDDYFCWDYDQRQNNKHVYLQSLRSHLILPLFLLLVLFIVPNIYLLNQRLNGLVLLCLTISFCLYLVLHHNKRIVYISWLKYPLLLFLVASYTHEINFIWIILASLFFLIREILEEEFLLKNRYLELIPFCVLILLKYFSSMNYFSIGG